jgi:hypothetical protein
MVSEVVTIEQGMMLQNLGLMAQCIGVGGFPNFAEHESGWFQAIGFRMAEMNACRYLGAGPVVATLMKLLGRDAPVPYPQGLEHNGAPLLKPFCPPYYPTMEAAVRAVVETKFGSQGVFRKEMNGSAWRDPEAVLREIPTVSQAAIDATVAYCDYLHGRYGRLPVYIVARRLRSLTAKEPYLRV